MTTTKQSHLNNAQLNVIADEVVDELEDILDYFQVKYRKNENKFYGPCPIHDGDGKTNPWNLYHQGDMYRGNWKCRSHGCEQIFKPTVIGLIRGLLSKERHKWSSRGDKTATFDETLAWISQWLKRDLSKISVDYKQLEKKKFVTQTLWMSKPKEQKLHLTREQVRSALTFPSAYYIGRGYSSTILDRYDIGECHVPRKEMTARAVIPVYDELHNLIIGCTGRSIYPQCKECDAYHDPKNKCPGDDIKSIYRKWRHNKGFLAEHHLFNHWYAGDFIDKQHSVVLVESPGNVLRLEEAGIHNSVALFGVNLSDSQLNMLYKYQIYTVNLLFDNDEAGKLAVDSISDKIKNIFNIKVVRLDNRVNDVGSLTKERVEAIIKPQIAFHN